MWARILVALLILSSPVLAQGPIGPVSGGIPAAVNTALAKKADKKTLTQLGYAKEIWISNREISNGADGVDGVGTKTDTRNGGTAAKFDAILRSVAAGTLVHVSRGSFTTTGVAAFENASNGYYLPAGVKIQGEGEYYTTIKLSYFPPSASEHTVFGNPSGTDAAGIEISDLTIDGNWSALGAANTKKINAVGLYGNNCKIRRVRAINFYGKLSSGAESFVLGIWPHIISGTSQTCVGAEISDCDVLSFLGDYGVAISIQGSSDGSTGDMSGAMFNNRVYNWPRSAAFQFSGNGIDIYGNYTASCVYSFYGDTYHFNNIRIHDNTFVNCIGGGIIVDPSLGSAAINNLVIDNNLIEIGRQGTSTGVCISLPGSNPTPTNNKSVIIRGNTLIRGSLGSYPDQAGIGAALTNGLLIENNRVDLALQNNLFIGSYDNTHLTVRNNVTETGVVPTGLANTDVAAITSASIDSAFGSTRGSILERGASGWTILAPGTSGNVLMSNGTGADPSYQVVGGSGTVANPSATIGLTAINGSNTSAIRSDGAPALSQAIIPIWTGLHTFQITDAVTNTFSDFQDLTHNSSGTPANGFGGSVLHMLQTSTSPSAAAERDIYYWTDAANATRSSAYRMQLKTNAGSLTDIWYAFGDGGMSLGANVDPGAGIFNVNTGFRIGNAATSTHFLRGNGTNYVDSAIQTGDIPDISATYMTPAGTYSVTNKTFDASATGNVLKRSEYLQLGYADNGDGTNAVRVTTEGPTFGHYTFKAGVAKASNYVVYRIRVPDDLDTAVDLAAAFKFRLGGADTGTHAYYISMADVASSASADSPTFSNEVAVLFPGDASGASGDVEHVTYVTLTSWKSSLTAGHTFVIKLARDGTDGTLDSSTVDSTDMNLTIRYGSSQ